MFATKQRDAEREHYRQIAASCDYITHLPTNLPIDPGTRAKLFLGVSHEQQGRYANIGLYRGGATIGVGEGAYTTHLFQMFRAFTVLALPIDSNALSPTPNFKFVAPPLYTLYRAYVSQILIKRLSRWFNFTALAPTVLRLLGNKKLTLNSCSFIYSCIH